MKIVQKFGKSETILVTNATRYFAVQPDILFWEQPVRPGKKITQIIIDVMIGALEKKLAQISSIQSRRVRNTSVIWISFNFVRM